MGGLHVNQLYSACISPVYHMLQCRQTCRYTAWTLHTEWSHQMRIDGSFIGKEEASLLKYHRRYTGPPVRMSHRKWRETKQQLSWLPDLALLGCCLLSLHFLCDILSGRPVVACRTVPHLNNPLLFKVLFNFPDLRMGTQKLL